MSSAVNCYHFWTISLKNSSSTIFFTSHTPCPVTCKSYTLGSCNNILIHNFKDFICNNLSCCSIIQLNQFRKVSTNCLIINQTNVKRFFELPMSVLSSTRIPIELALDMAFQRSCCRHLEMASCISSAIWITGILSILAPWKLGSTGLKMNTLVLQLPLWQASTHCWHHSLSFLTNCFYCDSC